MVSSGAPKMHARLCGIASVLGAFHLLCRRAAAVTTISWVLSEGDKRDSKSNMPEGEGRLSLGRVSSSRPSLSRGRSYFAPEPASRTRPRRTRPTLISVLPLCTRIRPFGLTCAKAAPEAWGKEW
ncbi:hypothetical protein F5Y01DRAFT_72410 [Xylaria sp. FL0043]|nr:hypothetical protein F5Y01DRAFT_72410 [Xylaria sp. FL0043]